MTDTPGSTPPFPGFPGFPPAEMLDQMWSMMRLSPFGSAFSGAQPAAGLGPSLSMMSDMMAPLTNVEELDKRITDMRAVEQWLKLNLSMLQSAIQALEVQRATLATLRAFGAFAQQSMGQGVGGAQSAESAAGASSAGAGAASGGAWPRHEPASGENSAADNAQAEQPEAAATPPFDASAWWNLLQTQFNQIAQFAMTQPSAAGTAATDSPGGDETDPAIAEAAEDAASEAVGGATDVPRASAEDIAAAGSATRRPAAKRAGAAAKRASTGTAASGSRPPKKSL